MSDNRAPYDMKSPKIKIAHPPETTTKESKDSYTLLNNLKANSFKPLSLQILKSKSSLASIENIGRSTKSKSFHPG